MVRECAWWGVCLVGECAWQEALQWGMADESLQQ